MDFLAPNKRFNQISTSWWLNIAIVLNIGPDFVISRAERIGLSASTDSVFQCINLAKSAFWQVGIQFKITFDVTVRAICPISLCRKGKSAIESGIQMFSPSMLLIAHSKCLGGRRVR
jgi:hypothetical protein